MAPDRPNKPRIAFYGHFGTLNTGNESTLVTILSRLRPLFPDWEFLCVCTNPESVIAELGIAAVPITSRKLRLWDPDLPFPIRAKSAVVGIFQEVGQYANAFKALESAEMLIVPGTGLLNDTWGLFSWGPYNLFKWSLAARLRGCRLLFLSVGAGPIYTGLGRLLIGSSLRMAHYRSYRDEQSLGVVKSTGVRTDRDRVYPDLVFDLPRDLFPKSRAGSRKRRLVGLGLMVYQGRYSATNPSDATYDRYLESLVVFADWLLARDYDLRLLLGDGEPAAITDFLEAFRARSKNPDAEERIATAPAMSVKNIVSQIAEVDIVVATRFHNVLLSLVLERPVIAVSFHHKCSSLMSEIGLPDYCCDIHELDGSWLIRQFQDLERNQDEVQHLIRDGVARSRSALAEQYAYVFEEARPSGTLDLGA